MTSKILYCGDTSITEAAGYLAGVMTHFGISFDYLSSNQKFTDERFDRNYQGIILSDYPASNFTSDQLTKLTERIRNGTGLLMIGGWESFTGLNREYTQTPLTEVLPVILGNEDDRMNCWRPCVVEKKQNHPIVEKLPFEKNTPYVGGYNRFLVKPDAELILSIRPMFIQNISGTLSAKFSDQNDPLLVSGDFGEGRTLAFASDVAPHWVGGLVDWGDARISAQAVNANPIEVGEWYAEFFANMVRWIINEI